jgi:thiamine biosynthesis lipoprotein
VVVTEPAALALAVTITKATIAAVDDACSRFRSDSELSRLAGRLPEGAEVSPVLQELIRGALDAARWTDGDVDPTLGNDLRRLGYDQDIARMRKQDVGKVDIEVLRTSERSIGWRRIQLDGSTLTVPEGFALDLGATAKAITADRAASKVAATLGCGVLVSIGGDIATSGASPFDWEIVVQDTPQDAAQQVSLQSGFSMATSSTQKRRWVSGGQPRHHILDPRFGVPAETVWRTASVAAETCLQANAFSTASIVRGRTAPAWLRASEISARLVGQDGRIVTTGSWPEDPAAIDRMRAAL